MGMMDSAIYLVSDAFIYVTQCETLALVGINDALAQLESTNRRRKKMQMLPTMVMGLIPNQVQALKEHVDNLQELRAAFGESLVWPTMRRLKTYSKMAKYGQTLRSLDSTTGEAHEVLQMVNTFEKGVIQWLQNQNATR